MKTLLYLYFSAIIAMFCCFTSCTKEPSACFDYLVSDTIRVYTPINFSSCAVDGHDFHWDFGDGNTSQEENPEHTYTFPGTYTVEQTVISKNGKAVTRHSEVFEVLHHKKMVINKISLLTFPEEFESPDIYMEFRMDTGAVHFNDTIHLNCKTNNAYPFEQGFPIEITQTNGEFESVQINFFESRTIAGDTTVGSFNNLPLKYIYYGALTPTGVQSVNWSNGKGIEIAFDITMSNK